MLPNTGHEQEILTQMTVVKGDLDRLGNNVNKLSDLYLKQIETNNYLVNKVGLLEQNLSRQEQNTQEILKIIKEGINGKDSLITQITDNRKNLENLLEQIKQEKIATKEKNQEQREETLMLIEQQNIRFNKKVAIISTVAAIATVIAAVIALFK